MAAYLQKVRHQLFLHDLGAVPKELLAGDSAMVRALELLADHESSSGAETLAKAG